TTCGEEPKSINKNALLAAFLGTPATRSLLGREGRCDRLDRAGRRGLRRLGLQWLSLSGCQPTITPPRGPGPKGNGSAGAAAPICRFLSKNTLLFNVRQKTMIIIIARGGALSNSLILLRTAVGSGRRWIAVASSNEPSAGLPQAPAGWPRARRRPAGKTGAEMESSCEPRNFCLLEEKMK
ncbi:hypothetical protein, partial [Geobacillus stearothermophilus]|uniref:hypothetical protein n=1 Tax=Geobacillus stearothermophilus TaxID=1422 RepID=UPI002E1DC833|nr:hypothetical protein [Geobacillus stearothermophilus]